MKIKLLCLSILVSLSACAKPPKTVGKSAHANGDSTPNLPQNPEGTMSTEGYTELTCGNKDTHRGIRSWRRLSNVELKNTVSAVFGVQEIDSSSLINDISKADVFDTAMVSSNFVGTSRFKGYMTFAENLSNKVDLSKLFPCLAQGKTCMTSTLKSLGAAAWRRPLTAEESTKLDTLYDQLVTDGYKSDEAARLMVQALVLSQGFLYRSELGELQADGSFELTSWELASALSYSTIRTVPDAELKTLAAADKLRDSAELVKQATRLLADAKAKPAWKDFGAMWLESNNVLSVVKNQSAFNDNVKSKLSLEMQNFFVDTMFSSTKSTWEHLLLADYTLGDSSSSFIYGGTVENGKIGFAEPQRRGLLGHAGFLAAAAVADTPNPIKRGVFVLGRLLCSGFAPAPPTEVPEPKSGLSNKELFQQHSQGACAGCHKFIDDFGFAMENFDELGKYRDKDAAGAIVINGTVKIDNKDVKITSPLELSEAIAGSTQGMECFARQTFRYALGRPEYASVPIVGGVQAQDKSTVSQLDKCQIQGLTESMKESGGDLKSAILDLVANPAFRLRLAGPSN
jgi:hypothetical protein